MAKQGLLLCPGSVLLNMKTIDKNFIIITAIFSSLMAGMFFVSQTATARPTAQPVGDNYPGKILYSDTRPETKNGALTVNNTLNADTIDVSGDFTPGSLCLAGDCKAAWPDITQPEWTLQQVINRSGYVSGGSIRVQAIRMKSPGSNSYFSGWPTYDHDNAMKPEEDIPNNAKCNTYKIMNWVNWGGLGSIASVRCHETLLWPYQN